DQPKPMAVKKTDLDNVFKGLNDFRSKDLLAGGGVGGFYNIDYVSLQKDKNDVVLKKTADGKWRFQKPAYGEADYDERAAAGPADTKKLTTVKALVGALEGLRVASNEDFVTPDATNLEQYGLEGDKPAGLRVEIKRKQEGEDKPELTQ